MPSELSFSSGSGLDYHLDKLCKAGLIQRKHWGHKMAMYSLTEEGVRFYEHLPRKGTREDFIRFLVSIIASHTKGEVSEEEIRRTLASLLKEEGAQVERG